MTSEREAKVWMLAAGVLVVWACTMVGCTTSTAVGPTTPLNRPSATVIEPTWQAESAITLSTDTAAFLTQPDLTLTADTFEAASYFAPSKPDVIVLQPRPTSPRFDVELSGLSIAQPLVSAKRLLVAAVTMLPPMTTPEWARATSAAAHADLADQPVAAATGWGQRLAFEASGDEAGGVALGVAALDRRAVMPAPWQTDPTPTPTFGATLTADEAKFDSAGVVATVLGAMVLLFGGEAVVMWALNRRRRLMPAAQELVADDAEESVFRFPEPITEDQDESYSRAA